MPMEDEIATRLGAQGVGVVGSTADYGIYKGFLPDAPDKAIGVFPSPAALSPLRRMAPDVTATFQERPRVQVQIRAGTYPAARDKAMDVITALDWLRDTVLTASSGGSGTRYHLVEALQRPPVPLLRDANDRIVFVTNFQVLRDRST